MQTLDVKAAKDCVEEWYTGAKHQWAGIMCCTGSPVLFSFYHPNQEKRCSIAMHFHVITLDPTVPPSPPLL